MTDNELIEAYIRYCEHDKPAENDPDFAAEETLTDLLFDDPERLYRLVDEIANRTDNQNVLASLGAGPIEDLLCEHGPRFVDRILDNARRDPRWRFALGCVWISRATNKEIKQRVESAIAKYFPNGTP